MKKNITYAMGQRISKTVTNKNTTDGTDKFVTTYYVRDPQGNVLAVYEHKHGDSGNGTFTLTEQHLYGASRLGMKKRDSALNATNANESPATYYELTNHLGNVMAVISDETSTTAEPTIVSLSDYYPFGMTEPGRSWNSGDYRYGFNGKEKEDANGIHLDFGARIYDSRIGRFLSVDPKVPKTMASYNFAGSPISCVDYEGEYNVCVTNSAADEGINNENLKPLFKILNCMSEIIQFSGVMEEIVKQTGFSESEIKEKFSYDDKSISLTIRSLDEHNLPEDNYIPLSDGSFLGQNMAGGIANGGMGNGVEISVEVINQLNNVLNSNASEIDKAAMALAVGFLILHETIHELDYKQNNAITTTGGKQNSTSVFNHRPIDVVLAVLGMKNIKNIDAILKNSNFVRLAYEVTGGESSSQNLSYFFVKMIISGKSCNNTIATKIAECNKNDKVENVNRNQRLLETGKKMIDSNAPKCNVTFMEEKKEGEK